MLIFQITLRKQFKAFYFWLYTILLNYSELTNFYIIFNIKILFRIFLKEITCFYVKISNDKVLLYYFLIQHKERLSVMAKINDAWFTVEEINNETYAISEYGHWEKVHSFLLLGEKRAVLIDTGLGIDNIQRISKQLTSLPITVITTHVHWDHIGSHGAFDDIYVHKEEVDWLIHGIPKLSIEQIRTDVGRNITLPTPKTFNPSHYKPFQGQPSGVLEDGDVINIGHRKLSILHTPGHSPGHIALLDHKYGYLFTGDLLYDHAPIYAFFPTTSPEDLVQSLEKIANLSSLTKIFGSHHTLGLDPSILLEVKKAVITLRENNLVHFGTGIHRFNGFSIQF